MDGRGLVCFLGVPQQHQRYLLLIVANLYISVLIKKRMKKSRFHKKYVIFWWASNQNWYEICEFVKICYYWVNNCEVPLSVWGLFASVQHFCQLQNLQPVIVYLKIVQFIIQTCKSMDFVRTYFFVSEPLSSLTLIFGI